MLFAAQLDPDEIVDVARHAEETGFDTVWNGEDNFDSFVYDQHVVLATRRVRTGSAIARYYKRHPLLIAETAAAIDRLAPGRFIIGLGTGPVRRSDLSNGLQRWGAVSGNPVEQLDEYIEIMRTALSGEEVNVSGRFYAIERVQLDPRPVTEIPIYLSAGGAELCRLAGRKADGAFLFFLGEQRTREWIDLIRREARDRGRGSDRVRICALIPCCVDTQSERARRALRRQLFFPYLARSYYQRAVATNGFDDVANEVRRHVASGDLERAADAISDEALDAIAIGGDPAECSARLQQFIARGIDAPILFPLPVDGAAAAAAHLSIDVFAPPGGVRA